MRGTKTNKKLVKGPKQTKNLLRDQNKKTKIT